MIIDYLEHSSLYENLIPNFSEGLAFAMSLWDKPVGRYEKGEMFAMVQQGLTKPIEYVDFEGHKKYVDIQILVDGEEMVEWDSTKNLEISAPYNDENDILFFKGNGQRFQIQKNMFYFLFPHDAHKPCCYVDRQTSYRKIVLKLKV